jgi:hypothetical protein
MGIPLPARARRRRVCSDVGAPTPRVRIGRLGERNRGTARPTPSSGTRSTGRALRSAGLRAPQITRTLNLKAHLGVTAQSRLGIASAAADLHLLTPLQQSPAQ